MKYPTWNSLSSIVEAMTQSIRSYEKQGVKHWDARMALEDLAYQAGGLLKLDMQLAGERIAKGRTKKELLHDIEMELAEVVALALFAAKELNLDVTNGFEGMLASDKEKTKIHS